MIFPRSNDSIIQLKESAEGKPFRLKLKTYLRFRFIFILNRDFNSISLVLGSISCFNLSRIDSPKRIADWKLWFPTLKSFLVFSLLSRDSFQQDWSNSQQIYFKTLFVISPFINICFEKISLLFSPPILVAIHPTLKWFEETTRSNDTVPCILIVILAKPSMNEWDTAKYTSGNRILKHLWWWNIIRWITRMNCTSFDTWHLSILIFLTLDKTVWKRFSRCYLLLHIAIDIRRQEWIILGWIRNKKRGKDFWSFKIYNYYPVTRILSFLNNVLTIKFPLGYERLRNYC